MTTVVNPIDVTTMFRDYVERVSVLENIAQEAREYVADPTSGRLAALHYALKRLDGID